MNVIGLTNSRVWLRYYLPPTQIERRWGYAAFVRASLIAIAAWWSVLPLGHVLCVALAYDLRPLRFS